MDEKRKTLFEGKILPVLSYVGAIGAGIMCIAYIVMVFVLINGFKAERVQQITIFALVNAGVGFIILQFLKVQGVSFAKMIPENEVVLKLYYQSKTKDKKNHSLTYFWVTSVIRDVITKCLMLAATTMGIIYIVIQGSNDYNLILLAFVNLLMFICFGFLGLVKAFENFNQSYIPFVKEKLTEKESIQQTFIIDEGGQENGKTLS